MNQEKPIAYEPHPVSPERKAELIAGGFRIVDVVFMPADTVEGDGTGEALPPVDAGATPVAESIAEPVRRGRPAKAKE